MPGVRLICFNQKALVTLYDRKSYYRLTKESESLVSEIKARGDLNIDEEPILSGTV